MTKLAIQIEKDMYPAKPITEQLTDRFINYVFVILVMLFVIGFKRVEL